MKEEHPSRATRRFERFGRFNIVGAAGVVTQLIVMWLLLHAARMDYMRATPISVAVTLVQNFIGHWRWTWHGRLGSHRDVIRGFLGFMLTNGLVSIAGNLLITQAIVTRTRVSPVAANALAIVVLGLINFALGDLLVFRAAAPSGRYHQACAAPPSPFSPSPRS